MYMYILHRTHTIGCCHNTLDIAHCSTDGEEIVHNDNVYDQYTQYSICQKSEYITV